MVKNKAKPTSVRLEPELQKELDERCTDLGCSRNDYVKESVKFMLYNESDFDFGNEDLDDDYQPQKTPREFDCKDGILYENGSALGKCSEYNLRDGKVHDKNWNYLGMIQHDPKPSVVLLD